LVVARTRLRRAARRTSADERHSQPEIQQKYGNSYSRSGETGILVVQRYGYREIGDAVVYNHEAYEMLL
jgi:hypothetical protein